MLYKNPFNGNSAGHTNKVNQLRVRFVVRWVTVRGYAVLVYNQLLRPTQHPILSWIGNEYRSKEEQCQLSMAGKVTVGLAFGHVS